MPSLPNRDPDRTSRPGRRRSTVSVVSATCGGTLPAHDPRARIPRPCENLAEFRRSPTVPRPRDLAPPSCEAAQHQEYVPPALSLRGCRDVLARICGGRHARADERSVTRGRVFCADGARGRRGGRTQRPRGVAEACRAWYRVFPNAGWSSLVARRAHNPKVRGSNPLPATKKPQVRGSKALGPVPFPGSLSTDCQPARGGV